MRYDKVLVEHNWMLAPSHRLLETAFEEKVKKKCNERQEYCCVTTDKQGKVSIDESLMKHRLILTEKSKDSFIERKKLSPKLAESMFQVLLKTRLEAVELLGQVDDKKNQLFLGSALLESLERSDLLPKEQPNLLNVLCDISKCTEIDSGPIVLECIERLAYYKNAGHLSIDISELGRLNLMTYSSKSLLAVDIYFELLINEHLKMFSEAHLIKSSECINLCTEVFSRSLKSKADGIVSLAVNLFGYFEEFVTNDNILAGIQAINILSSAAIHCEETIGIYLSLLFSIRSLNWLWSFHGLLRLSFVCVHGTTSVIRKIAINYAKDDMSAPGLLGYLNTESVKQREASIFGLIYIYQNVDCELKSFVYSLLQKRNSLETDDNVRNLINHFFDRKPLASIPCVFSLPYKLSLQLAVDFASKQPIRHLPNRDQFIKNYRERVRKSISVKQKQVESMKRQKELIDAQLPNVNFNGIELTRQAILGIERPQEIAAKPSVLGQKKGTFAFNNEYSLKEGTFKSRKVFAPND